MRNRSTTASWAAPSLFGSELKALRAHPYFNAGVDRAALTEFLRFGYVPAPASMFMGIRKLPPARWIRIAKESDAGDPATPYWSLAAVAKHAMAHRFAGTEEEAADEVDRLLRNSVRLRMISDVPIGAFLSGGIDSSTVVAIMQALSERPVRTFTIGFHERAYDEAETARAIAHHLGTEHTELYVTANEAQAAIPRLPVLYDEPFADSSQIPTMLVSELARRHVSVALSGDAGDEVFGGYTRYSWGENVLSCIQAAPARARSVLKSALLALPAARWDSLFATAGRHLPQALRQRMPGEKLHKLAEVLDATDRHDLYLRLTSAWREPALVVKGGFDGAAALTRDAPSVGIESFAEQMMFADTLSYLPDDILTKVDRATMSVGLEGRIPMLDQALVAFAWQLPVAMKVRSRQGKRPLRQVLARYVPARLFERPKMGFGVPIDAWLRGALRPWAESLLDEQRLRDDGFFEPASIRAKWREHLDGTRNRQHDLWMILMFQAWHDGLRRPGTAAVSASMQSVGKPPTAVL